jgi:hypothetical protein
MARRVYLHIGLPKTGTTFLQTTMWRNRHVLRERGLLYPGAGRLDHYHASKEVRGVPPARMGRHAGTWERLVGDLAAWEGDGLVSHEFLCMASAKRARAAVAALRPAEVEVLVTVRDYVLQFPALWQEALKMNSELSFDEFMDHVFARSLRGAWSWDSQDIPDVLRRWSRAVPASRVKIVTVPPPGQGRGVLWGRWLEALDADGTGLDLGVGVTNTSLGAAQAALLHRVKPKLSGPLAQGPERHRWVRKYFGHQVLVPQKGARFGPRPHDVERLRELADVAVAAIKERGHPVIGDLTDLVSAEPPVGLRPDEIPDNEIVDVAARAIEQMIRDVRTLTRERDHWRAQAEAPAPPPPRSWAARTTAALARPVRSRVRRWSDR